MEKTKSQKCATKYPIMLLHGAAFRDDKRIYKYWGRIPRALEKEGASVYFGNQDAWGSVESNAAIVKEKISTVLSRTGRKKVNLIAHSRGGLEARYLISAMGMDKQVASLTTISTPHRGSKTLDYFMNWPKSLYRSISFFVDIYSRMIGDKNPDFFRSSRLLSSMECRKFNKKYPDKSGVYYQSYMAKMKSSFSDPLFILTHFIVKQVEGENDGLCSIESGKWGDYKGEITGDQFINVSHAGIVDIYQLDVTGVDIRQKYIDIVEDLKNRGF